jgi:tetratricopeptide (TPR) repeat protein
MSSVINSESPALQGKRVAFVGKLGGVTRREAQQLVRDHGGVAVHKCSADVDLIVIGADELPLAEDGELLDPAIRDAAGDGRLEIISETQLWQRLGIVEAEQYVRRLYTPAMLADLLGVTVSIVRRWHRRGLIVPAREVHRLPYFDFQEIATAQRLAQLLAAGASPAAIEAKLAALSRYVPDVARPMAQLSVIVEGKQLLLRQGEGLVEPGGQLRIDFDALEAYASDVSNDSKGFSSRSTLSLTSHLAELSEPTTPKEMVEAAIAYEDEGELEAAVEMYRAALTAGGAQAEVCFHLAELLYMLGDISAARERYFMAIELDENFVEARANLGCVLAETGELELAVAAFQGTLAHHRDYPDVHYHLARTLDELERSEEADSHWREFLKLAPDSPWADEARDRLQ